MSVSSESNSLESPLPSTPVTTTDNVAETIASLTGVRDHIRTTWTGLLHVVANAPNGTSLFVQTKTPGEKGLILTMVFLVHNQSVYMSHSDHKEGAYVRLKHEEDGKTFFIANDDNLLLGNKDFGKDSGVKIWTTPTNTETGEVVYLPIIWETGQSTSDYNPT
jgi:hypothetical protein